MADSIELRVSVTSIKRVDPYVKDIIGTATQVALYKFNISTNEWEKTDKEGALFIYSRNGEPFHSIMVVNRLNKDNFIEPILRDFDYQMQTPFLLYRNSKGKIYGIWFFNRAECIRITYIIESLVDGLRGKSEEHTERDMDKNHNSKESNTDIFSMLSKAQKVFNRTPTKQESAPPTFSSTPRVPDVTSQSVMDFFAKASTKSTQKPIVSGNNSEQHVLQRLMSNPAHSVEHIEKQQRSITPQEQVNLKTKLTNNADRRSVPITFPSTSVSDAKLDHFGHDNGYNFRMTPPHQSNPTTGISPLAFLMQSQNQTIDESIDVLGTSPFAQFLENAQKPQLMTPMMFTSPNSKEKSKSPETFIGSNDEKGEPMEILTEKQLAQALIYLLKNNPDFTKQIHEAYVSSIMEKVNSSSSKSLL